MDEQRLHAHGHVTSFQEIFNSSFPVIVSSPYRIVRSKNALDIFYFLVDGLYPNRLIFAKLISHPTEEGESTYNKRQMALMKDIKRCFGFLQRSFRSFREESKLWYAKDIIVQSHACFIAHKMMVRMQQNG